MKFYNVIKFLDLWKLVYNRHAIDFLDKFRDITFILVLDYYVSCQRLKGSVLQINA